MRLFQKLLSHSLRSLLQKISPSIPSKTSGTTTENSHPLNPDAQALWDDLITTASHLRDASSVMPTLLFFASAPHHYVPKFRLLARHWLNSPVLCMRFERLRRTTPDPASFSTEHLERLDELLGRIEFGGKRLTPMQKHFLRQQAMKLQLADKDVLTAFSSIGLYRRHGQLRLHQQPKWVRAITTPLRYACMAAIMAFVGLAVAAIWNGRGVLSSIVMPAYFSLYLVWLWHVLHQLGTQWQHGQRIRSLLQIQRVLG